MAEYQFWSHNTSGETYAIRIENQEVTGCIGPLHHTEVIASDLPSFEYDDEDSLLDAQWVRDDVEQFKVSYVFKAKPKVGAIL